jgi:guanylate kinase
MEMISIMQDMTYATDERKTCLLIVGRTASGKDTLASAVHDRYGLTFVKSYTTRPKRYAGEDTHVFVTPDEAKPLLKDAVAYTKIGEYEYFATKQQVLASDGYIIDPRGVSELCKNMPETRFAIAYVRAAVTRRREAAMSRGDEETEDAAFVARERSEDAEFTRFEHALDMYADGDHAALPPNVTQACVIRNRYDKASLEDGMAMITYMVVRHRRTK